MRPSTSPTSVNVATRRITAAVVVTACVLLASIPRVDAADTSLSQLRTQRAALVTRIARLTDSLAKAQATVDVARERRFVAELAADEARQSVARHAVDTYVGSVEVTEVERLRRTVFGGLAADADRALRDRLSGAKEEADREAETAERALADMQRTVGELEAARSELEKTIAQREAAEAANAAARAANTSEAGASLRPRYARTTAGQRELFARFPFGAVSAIPDGLVPTGQNFAGNASWYGPGFDGRPTASGAIYDQEGPTVAHRTLPLGTILLLRRGDRAALVLVNDRGPFVGGRVLDLSHGVARILGTVQAGVAHVTAEILVPAN